MKHVVVILLLLVSAVPLLWACGDDRPPSRDAAVDIDSTTGDGAAGDSGRAPVPDGCVPAAETCNGDDDDCDGFTDEGRGVELTCASGEACVDAYCVCPAANTCEGRCVDLTRDREHCGACGNVCPATQVCSASGCCDAGVEAVDLLFMVDNSNSMQEEQASLSAAFPQLIRALTTGDATGDGTPDFPAVQDLHVGVITSDMGTFGVRVPSCPVSSGGDDAVLRTNGNPTAAGCMSTYPSFLSWRAGMDITGLAEDFTCVASVGTGGCGFEQQLEATLKALTPSTSTLRFFGDSAGHADGANDGFLRRDSVLAIVLVTDEEDCSAADPDLFNPSSTTYSVDLNLRCFTYPMAVHPIDRYVSGIIDARGRSSHIVFAAIAGIPTDAVGLSYRAMLEHPDMEERLDPDNPERLQVSCVVPGRGSAYPPRRIVEVARRLERRGAGTTVQSICQADFVPAIEAIAARVGTVVGALCGPD